MVIANIAGLECDVAGNGASVVRFVRVLSVLGKCCPFCESVVGFLDGSDGSGSCVNGAVTGGCCGVCCVAWLERTMPMLKYFLVDCGWLQ